MFMPLLHGGFPSPLYCYFWHSETATWAAWNEASPGSSTLHRQWRNLTYRRNSPLQKLQTGWLLRCHAWRLADENNREWRQWSKAQDDANGRKKRRGEAEWNHSRPSLSAKKLNVTPPPLSEWMKPVQSALFTLQSIGVKWNVIRIKSVGWQLLHGEHCCCENCILASKQMIGNEVAGSRETKTSTSVHWIWLYEPSSSSSSSSSASHWLLYFK